MRQQTRETRHPLWVLLDGIQMDVRALEARIVELRARIAALGTLADVRQWQPALGVRDEAAAVRALIANRVIDDDVTLEAELRATTIDEPEQDRIRADFAGRGIAWLDGHHEI